MFPSRWLSGHLAANAYLGRVSDPSPTHGLCLERRRHTICTFCVGDRFVGGAISAKRLQGLGIHIGSRTNGDFAILC